MKKVFHRFFLIFIIMSLPLTPGNPWAQIRETTEVKIVPLPDVIEPRSFVTANEKIIIPERTHIALYSLKDFQLEKKFGRTGEGPGEFSYPPKLTAFPEYLLANTMGKLIRYSYGGEFLDEIKINVPYNYGIWPLIPAGDNYVGFPTEVKKMNPGKFQILHVGRL